MNTSVTKELGRFYDRVDKVYNMFLLLERNGIKFKKCGQHDFVHKKLFTLSVDFYHEQITLYPIINIGEFVQTKKRDYINVNELDEFVLGDNYAILDTIQRFVAKERK